MPRSKRNKVIPLTKTKKTIDKDRKIDLIDKVHTYLDEFSYVYVFRYKNMTNLPMQELRNYWKDAKFVIGKNKVLQIALGKSEDTSYKTNSYLVSPFIKNSCGLLFSNQDPDYVIDYFKNYSCPYYGAAGTIANQTIVLNRLSNNLEGFPTSMESQFRQLGVKIKLENAKFIVLEDYLVCKHGEPLTPEQAMMVKHLGIQMDEFKFYITCHLSKGGEFKNLNDIEI